MNAPHERQTAHECHERAMRLAGVLMRGHPAGRGFVAGINEASGLTVAAIDEAGRRADEMRWPGVADGLASLRRQYEGAERERAEFAANRAAGRFVDERFLRVLGVRHAFKDASHHLLCEDGLLCVYVHWPASVDPWAACGEQAYRACLANMDQVPDYWRQQAAFVWERLNEQQRAAVSA